MYLAKSWNNEIYDYHPLIALIFDRRFGSTAAEASVKFSIDTVNLKPNLTTSWETCG